MKSTEAQFRAVLGFSTLAMLVWSWPLWVGGTGRSFPSVPFCAGMHHPGVPLAFLRFVALLASILAASLGFWLKRALGLALILMAWLVAEDQFRLQPWVYQFLLMGLALATVPGGQALGLCRLFVIAMYFHSGLSKLDITFVHEMGQSFLATMLGWFGLTDNRWPAPLKTTAILVMPVGEMLIAIGLCFRRTRIAALVGAILFHVILIAILGPFGLGHSTIVLFWNASLIVEVLLLFGSKEPVETIPEPSRLAGITRIVFVLAILLPFTDRWGFWDSWPSFALYSSHNERVVCKIPGELDHLPIHDFDLNAWSLAERRVPVYPQGRALNGVAEFLATRYGKNGSVRVVHRGRADRWTGKRKVVELIGLEAIRRHGDSYRLNAHPIP